MNLHIYHNNGKYYRHLAFTPQGRQMVLCAKDGWPLGSRVFTFPMREVDEWEIIMLPIEDIVMDRQIDWRRKLS